jgi:3-mercaptopyruvate sulfurtransferase SseA
MKKVMLRWLHSLSLIILCMIIPGCENSSDEKNTENAAEEYCISNNLVSPAWVDKLIQYHEDGSTGEAPLDYEYERTHNYLIFETSWGPVADAADYNAGHVPGAIHSDSDIYENGDPRWFIISDADIFDAMESMGITADTTVIVYGADPIFAARLWWILKYAGLEDVRYLDGGYEKWVADGFDGETTVNYPTAATVDYTGPVNPEFIATVDYVADHYTDTDNYILADVRDEDEYNGIVPGYDYVIEKGRIPNAVWFYPVGGANDAYFNADTTLKPLDEILSMWQEFGVTDGDTPNTFNKEIIFYCGSGYRSASSFFYAYLMGYTNVRNFSDGWEGWSTTYTYDLTDDCSGGVNGQKHGAWPSDYCQMPSGREIEP